MRLTFVKGITNVHLSINRIKIDLVLILIGICPIFFLSDNLNPLEVLRNQRIAFFLVASLLIIATCHANKFIGAFLLLSVAHLFMFPSVDYFEVKMKFLICGALVYHFVHQNYLRQLLLLRCAACTPRALLASFLWNPIIQICFVLTPFIH